MKDKSCLTGEMSKAWKKNTAVYDKDVDRTQRETQKRKDQQRSQTGMGGE